MYWTIVSDQMEGQDVHIEAQECSSREELEEGTSDNKSEPSDEEFFEFSQVHSALESEERGLDNENEENTNDMLEADINTQLPEPEEEEEADLLGLHLGPVTAETSTIPGEMKGSSSNAVLLDNLFSDNLFKDDLKTDIQTDNLLGSGEDYFFSKQTSAESGSLFNASNSTSGMQQHYVCSLFNVFF